MKTTKILGMIFDQKMTWKTHIQSLKTNCLNSLNVMKMVAHRNWGADRKHLKLLYNSLVRSKLDYGAIIYDSAKKSELQKLNKIQNTSIRLITGAMYSSPIPSIHVESNMLPLHYRRILLCLSYFTKLAFRQQVPTYPHTIQPKYSVIYARKTNKPKPVGIRCSLYSEAINYDPNNEQNIPCSNILTKTQKRKINLKIKVLQDLIEIQWQKEWDEKFASNKLYEIKPKIEEWKSCYSLSRKEETTLARIRIGHIISTHSFLLNRLPPPQCDQCNTRLSVKHLLLECTKYTTHRSTIFESNTELAQILGDNSNLRNLFNYINVCNLVI